VADWNNVNNGNPGGWQKYWMLSWMTRCWPYFEQDNAWKLAEIAESGPVFPGDTGAWVPYQYYGWDTSRYGVCLAHGQPMLQCPADSRTIDTQIVTEQGFAPIPLQLTAYLGVEGICHNGGGGSPNAPNNEKDPTTGLLTGQNGVIIEKQNLTGVCPKGVKIADIIDGTSNTMMIGERPPPKSEIFSWAFTGYGNMGDSDGDVVLGVSERNQVPTYDLFDPQGNPCSAGSPDPNSPLAWKIEPGDLNNECSMLHFWSLHAGGANFSFADGSVHFLTYDMSPILQRALSTRNGGEVAELP
jgi:prepilin-type processing-associated H-X9-DG protein